jgi:hypothetical protein
LFKVLKRPVALELQPAPLRALLGYEFFKVDPDTGRVRELDEIFGPEAEREFWIKLDDLAHDICALVELLQGGGHAGAQTSGAIFLAETTSDLRAERDVVRRGLLQQGYTVLPSRALPLSAADAAAAIAEDLERCRMSVHMFGAKYGIVPEGGSVSILELQNDLALERARSGDFARLVWIPRDQTVAEERQVKVIQHLRMDQRAEQNADLLETSLEELQTQIDAWLKQPPKPRTPPSPTPLAAAAQLYLVYDQRDLGSVQPWSDFLFEHFEVVHPAFDGDEAEIRAFHEENLQTCDGVLIFYGAGSQVWLRRKLAEVQKSAGYRRAKGMPELAVCIIPPETAEKAIFRTHLATVIQQVGGFSDAPLQPYVEALKARTRGSPS